MKHRYKSELNNEAAWSSGLTNAIVYRILGSNPGSHLSVFPNTCAKFTTTFTVTENVLGKTFTELCEVPNPYCTCMGTMAEPLSL